MSKKLETHQEALERLQLKVGDTVRLISKAVGGYRGWPHNWDINLNDYIGYIGYVNYLDKTSVYISFNDEMCNFSVPSFVLEKDEDKVCFTSKKNVKSKDKFYILIENDYELCYHHKSFSSLEEAKKEVEDAHWDDDKYTIIKKIITFKSEHKTSWINES